MPIDNTNAIIKRRARLAQIVEIGASKDTISRGYDFFSTIIVIVNLAATILYTFTEIELSYGPLLVSIEGFTAVFFTIDYILRVITARCLYPALSEPKALLKYIFSFTGIVDVLSFLPYYLPFFFPAGAVTFRMFRVVRILRLFRINAYYDSLNVIGEVLNRRRQQLISSVFIIMILMVAASLCMYSLENEAQPDVFANAFSGIWWAVSTLLTVGYGDIYPITSLGKVFSIIITFLGVGMVAIPTGIISAGFVEQYTRLQKIGDYAEEESLQFIRIKLKSEDPWVNTPISDYILPDGIIIAAIIRGSETIIPRGDVVTQEGDTLILAAKAIKDNQVIDLKEILLHANHPWNGIQIQDLDISRRTIIVIVQRKGRILIPHGDLKLCDGDSVMLYTKTKKNIQSFDD